jgi:TPP-dependent pyruvate/acetoin dehydrogenase alpha subunit
VLAATREAVARARGGEGPTLIECVTYRLAVHTTADEPSKYRSEEEVEAWRRRDPIPRLQNHMKARELLTDAQIEALEEEVKGEIEDAWTETQAEMERLDSPETMFEHHYAELPRHLREQRDSLRRDPEREQEQEQED